MNERLVHRLLARADTDGDRLALVAGGDEISWGELGARVRGAARQLADAGVGSGDRVVLAASTSASFVCGYFATHLLDAVALPVDPRIPAGRLGYICDQVEPREDRLEAIAARYIDRVPCPTKDWEERSRIQHILELADQWNVAGAIVMQQKFCDPHELDTVAIRKALDEKGIKTLFLEFDVTVPVGQFKVRVEAFLEMLSDEDLFD